MLPIRKLAERSKQLLENMIIKQRKLRCFGHISRSSWLAKTIIQGTVKEKSRCRQKKRWEDTITEWTGMTSNVVGITRAAENRATYCCKVVCCAPTTLQVIWIDKIKLEIL